MKKTMTVLAAALALSSAVHAAGPVEGYGQIGFSDVSGLDDGLALKGGVDFAKNLGGVKGLGMTAFASYWGGESGPVEVTGLTFAGGPTFDLPLPNTKVTLQGRVFLAYSRVEVDIPRACGFGFCVGGGSVTDSSIDLGIGLGGAYQLDNRMSVRVDYDMIDADGADADIFTVGIGYKF